MGLFDEDTCRLCASKSKPNFAIFESERLTKLGDMMILHIAQISHDSGYPEVVCQFCQLQLNVFFEFKRKVFEQNSKFFDIITKHCQVVMVKENNSIDRTDIERTTSISSATENEYVLKIDSIHRHNNELDHVEIVIERQSSVSEPMLESADDGCTIEEFIEEQYLMDYGEDVAKDSEHAHTIVAEESPPNEQRIDPLLGRLEAEPAAQDIAGQVTTGTTEDLSVEFIVNDDAEIDYHAFYRSDVIDDYYECYICAMHIQSKDDLKEHFETVHLNDKPRLKSSLANTFRFSCRVCNKGFDNRLAFTMHEFRHTNERPIKCTVCDKSFKLTCDLRVHMGSHNNVRKYTCEICGKACRQRSHLKEHRETHNAADSMSCTMCDMKFKTSSTLKCHVRQVHSSDHDFKCTMCERTFFRRNKLLRHIKTHLNRAKKTLKQKK